MSATTLACGPILRVAGEPVRLLALLCDARGDEAYLVACADGDGRLRQIGGGQWQLTVAKRRLEADLGSPDAVFTQALGAAARPFSPASAPHWPAAITARLARRGLSGAGVIAFDADWFLATLTASAMDRPMLLPDAAASTSLPRQRAGEGGQRRPSGQAALSC